jgi:HSP20 family molecular chaperone IbpA
VPPVDVVEDGSGITVYADLPGVPRDNLVLEVEADTLTIQGTMNLPMSQGLDATHAEVAVPRFRRVFTLSRELDTGQLQAELKDGVLKLRIQKAEHARPRRIEVRSN